MIFKILLIICVKIKVVIVVKFDVDCVNVGVSFY